MNRSPISGYMGRTGKHLQEIIQFLKSCDPDVVGLVEVDAGSYRSERKNQAEKIAQELGHHHSYRCKYPDEFRWLHRIPVLNKQGNAFICRDGQRKEKVHYVSHGVKRLVLELELENVVFLLLHLALSYRKRQEQLREVRHIVRGLDKPCIVAGDFNVMSGPKELELFLEASSLQHAGPEDAKTFPSWKPKLGLDFILYSPGIEIKSFDIPQVQFSDHLPIICEFELSSPALSGNQSEELTESD